VPPGLDSSPNAVDPGAHGLSAAELFDRANGARRGGNVAEAVRGYETLLASFPNDGRAGLAAFELGRLRMDRLGDYASAVSALKRAVSLAPGAGFREDAMARLVQAYAALGSKSACQSARDAYLKAYPKGVHLGTVSRKCD
jgi:outer membrane protein assembly factor BamD (BamD/ComL family)